MAYTINGNIPCGTEACTGREHTPAGACNSVYDIILDAIKEVKGDVANVDSLAKEATLIAKVAELKEALNSIDLTAIEQAIQGVEGVTAREATLIQGVGDIIKAVENIDFTDLENSIAEVKNAVANIDFSALAKQSTLLAESQVIQEAIANIDLSSVESKVEEVDNKIDNIKLPEIDTTNIASKDIEKFFGLPAALPEGYEFMTPEEVCSTLEDIMTSMDLSLTPQQAQAITQATLTQQ